MELKDARVTIVGLGLIGGSMALALRDRCRRVSGVDVDQHTAELARLAGIAIRDLNSALTQTDVLVLAPPVKKIIELLEWILHRPPRVHLILDVGSTKRDIVQAMQALPETIAAIGGHPLVGKETSGFAAAQSDLFEGVSFILTPCSRTTPAGLALGEQLVASLGAIPVQMDPQKHDRLLAATSHLPYVLSAALVGSAEVLGRRDPDLWKMVASGFLSTSRLAASDLSMMIDILLTNQDMVLGALHRAQEQLDHMQGLLEAGKAESLLAFLEPLRQRRASFIHPREHSHGA